MALRYFKPTPANDGTGVPAIAVDDGSPACTDLVAQSAPWLSQAAQARATETGISQPTRPAQWVEIDKTAYDVLVPAT